MIKGLAPFTSQRTSLCHSESRNAGCRIFIGASRTPACVTASAVGPVRHVFRKAGFHAAESIGNNSISVSRYACPACFTENRDSYVVSFKISVVANTERHCNVTTRYINIWRNRPGILCDPIDCSPATEIFTREGLNLPC